MARRTVQITHATLAELGPDRLADLLIDHAAADKSLEKKLKLALAAHEGSDTLLKTLAQRIQAVSRGTKFIEWNEAATFAAELDQIRSALVADLAPKDPRSAADLLADFIHASDRIYERSDDSGGSIGDVFHQAIQDWGRVWSGIRDRRPEALAGVVLHEFEHDNYGLKGTLIPAFAEALGPTGLDELARQIREKLGSMGRPSPGKRTNYEANRLIRALSQIADAKHDPDAFVETVGLTGFPERHAVEIAARMLTAGRPGEALEWLDRSNGMRSSDEPRAVDLRITALDELGRHDDAQAVRWGWVADTLSVEHFRDYVDRLASEAAEATRNEAVDIAIPHRDVYAALRFLVSIDATSAAGQVVVDRLVEIDGRHYHVLRPVADQLAETEPLAAVLLYREMAEAVLDEARSKYYSYAATDVLSAGRVAVAVTDWKGHEDHTVFMDRLRQQHGRKSAFWPLLDEKPRRRTRG